MGWSADATLLGDSPPGNEVVSYPATPPIALLGERRAAPPGTRLRGRLCHFVLAQRRKVAKQQRRNSMKIHTIGIDLDKTNFHLVGLNERGEVVVRKRLSRAQ